MHAAAKILQDFNERNINFKVSFLRSESEVCEIKLVSSVINTWLEVNLGGFWLEIFMKCEDIVISGKYYLKLGP